MKYYNLLFVGLMQISDSTQYKGISEYVAAWFLGLIIELNLMAILSVTTLGPTILKPYVLVGFYVAVILLNVKYYNINRVPLDKLAKDLEEKHRPNMTSGQLLAIFILIESASIVPLIAVYRHMND